MPKTAKLHRRYKITKTQYLPLYISHFLNLMSHLTHYILYQIIVLQLTFKRVVYTDHVHSSIHYPPLRITTWTPCLPVHKNHILKGFHKQVTKCLSQFSTSILYWAMLSVVPCWWFCFGLYDSTDFLFFYNHSFILISSFSKFLLVSILFFL